MTDTTRSAVGAARQAPRGAAWLMLGAVTVFVAACGARDGGPSTTSSTAASAEPPQPAASAAQPEPLGYRDVADASILRLPSPMPAGWAVWGVVSSGEFEMDWPAEGPDLTSDPPLGDGIFREYIVWMGRTDGAARAQLAVVETPVADHLTFGDGAEATTIDGRELAVTDLSDEVVAALSPSGTETPGRSYSWIDDGRRIDLRVVGSLDDAEALVTATRHVSGAEVTAAIAVGQDAAAALPVVATTTLDDGTVVEARGTPDDVLAVCADWSAPLCWYAGIHYGFPRIALGQIGPADSPRLIGWIPPEDVDVAVGPAEVIRQPTGALIVGGTELGLAGRVDAGSGGGEGSLAVGAARTDLLAIPLVWELPRTDGPPTAHDVTEGTVDLLTGSEPFAGGMDALGTFTLAYDLSTNCLYAPQVDGRRTTLVWPFGTTAKLVNGIATVFDADGRQIAAAGQEVSLGGGFVGPALTGMSVDGSNTCAADELFVVNDG